MREAPVVLEVRDEKAPFKIGDRVDANDLKSWVYTGLSGKSLKDKDAVRCFTKGMWVLEIYTHVRADRDSRVVSIRSADTAIESWRATRDRLMRNKSR